MYTVHLHKSEDKQFYTTLNSGSRVVYTQETVKTKRSALGPAKGVLSPVLMVYYYDHTDDPTGEKGPIKRWLANNAKFD